MAKKFTTKKPHPKTKLLVGIGFVVILLLSLIISYFAVQNQTPNSPKAAARCPQGQYFSKSLQRCKKNPEHLFKVEDLWDGYRLPADKIIPMPSWAPARNYNTTR